VLRLKLCCLFVDFIILLTVEGSFIFGNLTPQLSRNTDVGRKIPKDMTFNSIRPTFGIFTHFLALNKSDFIMAQYGCKSE
jgi:hypothetical protein